MGTPGSKGQEGSHVEPEKLDPKEHREFRSGAGICQYVRCFGSSVALCRVHCLFPSGRHDECRTRPRLCLRADADETDAYAVSGAMSAWQSE